MGTVRSVSARHQPAAASSVCYSNLQRLKQTQLLTVLCIAKPAEPPADVLAPLPPALPCPPGATKGRAERIALL